MKKTLLEILNDSQKCSCGNTHNQIPIESIVVENGAIKKAVTFIEQKNYKHPILVVDKNTYHAAGIQLSSFLKEANINHSICQLQPDENNDVVADEKSIVQLLVDSPRESDVIIAVGSGTIHDIARFCAFKTGIPFVSVPTAPSVDGFTSMGAPLVIRGVKKTFQTTSPVAVFADLTVLKQAPQKLIAAGFGDMLAKCTSLVDWKFGHLVAGEPYCPLVAEMTKEALDSCVENAGLIAEGNEKGIRLLIEALIQSGLAMLLFGQSHPASGGEHHLSHYWEMEFLRLKRPQVLHGAKVAVSTSILAELYKTRCLNLIDGIPHLSDKVDLQEDRGILNSINENKEKIVSLIKDIPDPSSLRNLVLKVGGAALPHQLGIDNELVNRSLHEAYLLRDRFTILKFLNKVAKIEKNSLL